MNKQDTTNHTTLRHFRLDDGIMGRLEFVAATMKTSKTEALRRLIIAESEEILEKSREKD